MDIKKLLNNLHDELCCSVCMNTFTDPKTLPCLHSFCLHCLRGIHRTSGRHDMITCPECRTEKVRSVVETSTLCPPIFESTVCLMCWPLNSVILLRPNAETVTRRAHTVTTASIAVIFGVTTVSSFTMVCEPTKSTGCWRSKIFRRKTLPTF